ncbi:hypothetical protein HU200_001447 [Digitaria exilis]|uniref:RING-type domain-containing protein n=1 Tax=Digitaria exilis TaxID=1010633 RepID=A0A835KVS8_9POAL|nr:hypothetical protein HU200_001447 [Digitaria exilis]
MAMERRRELQGLSNHRAVSAFAHRARIQSFLRGRFFRSGYDERPSSMAARESGHSIADNMMFLTREEDRSQTQGTTSDQSTSGASSSTQNSCASNEHDSGMAQAVSDNNHRHIENATRHHEIQTNRSMMEDEAVCIESTVPEGNNVLQHEFSQEQTHQYEEYSDSGSSGQDSVSTSSTASGNSIQQEAQTYRQETDLPWSRDISSTEDGHRDEGWHVIESQDDGEPRWQLSTSFNSTRNRFSPPEDDVYGFELRELLSRRSVSNLLSSGFRESLDQLIIRSYVERQEHDPDDDWDFEEQRPTTGLLLDEEDPIEIPTRDESSDDTAPQPSIMSSDQTLFPQQRHHHNWSQQTMHRSEFVSCKQSDWDAIHVLRDELSGIQRGMTSMQQMLEACMEMQIELQRSIKQEVSAALNRSLTMRDGETLDLDGSQWKLARKGTCCICCDNQIDSLLYRCGHMCTCSKCASELLHGVGKCPLCRAPIVEVIRAYCIM